MKRKENGNDNTDNDDDGDDDDSKVGASVNANENDPPYQGDWKNIHRWDVSLYNHGQATSSFFLAKQGTNL